MLLLSDGRLASSSGDLTIKIYNIINNYHCDMTINTQHSVGVFYICQIHTNKLVSCSFDCSIRIWSIYESSYQCDYIIKNAHDNNIFKVIQLTEKRFASCSFDETIKIWNSNPPYNHIITMIGHKNSVNSIIQLKEKNILISGSNDETLRNNISM